MQIQYYPFDFSTNANKNRRESEQEYFMRIAREFEAARALQKREETKQKIKAAFTAALNLLKFKRTQNLEALLGR
ncbi:hypothetical protein [Marinobacterium rhizophilum]|uniref:Uncharacterized protein n=1 Tax=Marinobacterium rhizophilum TaxID=420402 RepID=A0ABY5HMW1_9GAMM|nr:hypothetical protein [Marinobacterium rhizophilum]UTW13613.1 hypothetical protein KDW95_08245 [Marinobacterium rhizophilum]